jgi:hypothetical protein
VDRATLLKDLYEAGVPLTISPTRADYALRPTADSHGFHCELADHQGNIVWQGKAHTEAGVVKAVLRFLRQQGLLQ